MKRLAIIILLVAALACITGCTPGPASTSGDASTSLHEEKVALPAEAMSIEDVRTVGDGSVRAVAVDELHQRAVVYAQEADGAWAASFDADELSATLVEGDQVTARLTPQGELLCVVTSNGAGSSNGSCFLIDADSTVELPCSIENTMSFHVEADGTVVVCESDRFARIDLATGEKVSSARVQNGTYLAEAVLHEGLVYTMASRTSGASMEMEFAAHDADTGASVAIDPALQAALEAAVPATSLRGAYRQPLLASGSDGLYVCAQAGVYRCTGAGAQMVLEPTGTHLANENEAPSLLDASDEGLAIVYRDDGAGSGRMTACRYVAGEAPETSEELVVYALEDSAVVQQAVALFRDEHPEAAVTFELGMPEGSGISADDALRALNADLLAGAGPDVLVLDGLPLQAFKEQGMLRNLSSVLEAALAEDAYYENIVRTFATDEGCFAIPMRCSIPAMMGDTDVLARAETLEELTAYLGSNDETRAMLAFLSPTALYLASRSAIVGEGGAVDAEALASFYDGVRQMLDIAQESRDDEADAAFGYRSFLLENPLNDGAGIGSLGPALASSDARFAVGLLQDPLDFGMAGIAAANVGYPCACEPLTFDGALAYLPSVVLGVSSGTTSPALAEEFVATALARDQQMQVRDAGLPVCASAFEGSLPEGPHAYGTIYMSEDRSTEIYERGELTPEEVAACNSLMASASVACVDDKAVADAIAAGLRAYCMDDMTLDRAVAETVRKIDLYRAE